MATILQIETSTTVCSAAIAVNGECIAVKELDERNIHAGSLTIFIEEVMKTAKIPFSALNAVAVAKGPGSYTGLRIGVSTAKGLCFALDIPMIAVNTLEMMAMGFKEMNPKFNGLVAPMLDARRMEVYTALFNNDLSFQNKTTASIIDADFLKSDLLINEIAFFGDGAAKCREMITSANARFVDGSFNSAKYLSAPALAAFNNRDFVDVAYFEPYYLKDFVVTQATKKDK